MIIDKNIPCRHEEHKKYKIECDYKISNKCRKEYYKEIRCIFSDRENNSGKDICVFCSRKLKNTGRKNSNMRYYLDDEMMGIINSESKAYFLGWIASDGHISINNEIVISVNINDSDILQRILDFVYPNKEFRPNLVFTKNSMVKLSICSKTMCEDICAHLGIQPGKKSDIIKFPKLDNEELNWAFIRGFFDGDGSIRNPKKYSTPSCKITSNSQDFRKHLIEFCKIPCKENKIDINWEGVNALDFLGKIYDNSTIKLCRKYNDYMDWVCWVPILRGENNSGCLGDRQICWYKTREDAVKPFKERVSDSGYDLTIIEKKKEILNGSIVYYDTGIKISMPHGYYFRSCTKKFFIKDRLYVG